MTVRPLADHYPEGDPPSEDALCETLREVVDALGEDGIDFLLMGGISAYTHARPRVTQDIDVFVRPGDVERVRAALQTRGFEVADHDPMWLMKGWKRGVLVDVVFRSSGGIYVDDEMLRRRWSGDYKGTVAPLVAPEDLLVIKALTAAEGNPQHWYDALAIISRCSLDWDYLVDRARQAGTRRVLSLLLFAESLDLVVPAPVIERLFDAVHPRPGVPRVTSDGSTSEPYVVAHVQHALALDPRVMELGIDVVAAQGTIVLMGRVATADLAAAAVEVAAEQAPGYEVRSDLELIDADLRPAPPEHLG